MNPSGRPAQLTTCGHDARHYARGMCRSCYDKERNQAHPERRRNYHKKRYSKNPELWKSRARDWVLKNPIKYALRLAKQSAATRGLEFDLDEDYA